MKIKSLGFIHAPLLRKSGAGFTLIELLIVIAILGIVAAGVVVAVNPLGKLNSANLAKAKTFSASTENALIISQVGKWSFESVVANKTPDTSGYGRSGTVTGAALQNETACGLGFGGCLKFDGVNDYITIPNVSQTQAITISFWLKSAYSGGGGYRGNFISQDPGFNIGSTATGEPTVTFSVWTSSTTTYSPNYVATVSNPGNWHHFVLTISNAGEKKIYIDGAIKDTVNMGNRYVGNSNILIGYGDELLAYVDEVAIYSQALLSSQIQQLYARGLSKHQLVYNK